MTPFQIVSDIHLEKTNISFENFVNPKSENLILAGDICSVYMYDRLHSFIQTACSVFKRVFYVPGNHEFYNPCKFDYIPISKFDIERKLNDLEKEFPNLFIMNKRIIELDDVVLIGCTLWSKPEDHKLVRSRINKMRMKNISYNIYTQLHMNDVKFLENALNNPNFQSKKKIVITHYCPSFDFLSDKYKQDVFNSLYASNLNNLITKQKVHTWIYGHTHSNVDIEFDGVKIVTNQYSNENNKTVRSTDFILDKIIIV